MRPLLLLAAVGLLALPSSTFAAEPPAGDDVAWLASLLGVAPDDLPLEVPAETGAWGPEGFAGATTTVPLASLAAQARAALPARTASEGAPEPALFAGAGADAGAGVRWSGIAVGFLSMDCIAITAEEVPQTRDLLASGEAAFLRLRARMPTEDAFDLAGVARMMVQAVPAPAVDAVVSDALLVDADVLAGRYGTVCFEVFGLRFSFAFLVGDGTLRGGVETPTPA